LSELEYWIDATNPANHELSIRVQLPCDATTEITLFLPSWTPGSYLIRDYARHLSRVEAFDPATGHPLTCHKASKNRYVVTKDDAEVIELRYRVYCHELSVRTSHVDSSHAFWNHACILLWPVDQRDQAAVINIEQEAGSRLFCTLQSPDKQDGEANVTRLRASDLDDAIDAPVLITSQATLSTSQATADAAHTQSFQVDGVDHFIVLDGLAPIEPPPSLCDDLQAIVQQAHAVFGGELPYEQYHWLSLFTDDGYGGLEHRDSSVLLMPRTALSTDRGYRDFLALAAHELFHAWNVKRMRPTEFWRYDYENENYTKLLWLMEGWTAYYDDLLVARAGLMSESDYLATMAKNIHNMLSAPGRFELSLEESSFDAWVRLYKPDENTRNSSQNYYGNGAVAAMCLDLLIRRATEGRHSIDDALRALYQATFLAGRGYEDTDVHAAIEAIAGEGVVAQLRGLVTGALDPQLEELLADVGVDLTFADAGKAFLGVSFKANTTTIASVTKGSPASIAGLAPNDEVLAANNLRIKAGSWRSVFAAVGKVDEPMTLLVARRGILETLDVTPTAAKGTAKLGLRAGATKAQCAARTAWLGDATRAVAQQ
jgi:predicted metalloprotease with PDZ domain